MKCAESDATATRAQGGSILSRAGAGSTPGSLRQTIMKYRIYHNTTLYGNETRGLELLGSEVLVECSSVNTALALADAMSGYADAGLTGQYLVECPECGHSDIEECGGGHVVLAPDPA